MSTAFSWNDPATWLPAAMSFFGDNPIILVLAVLVLLAGAFIRSAIVFPLVIIAFFAALVFIYGDTALSIVFG
jgi:hypothetical protein